MSTREARTVDERPPAPLVPRSTPNEELASGMQVTPSLRLVTQIGQGGMGTLWLAEHVALRARVVVKFMSAALVDRDESRARFEREAAAAAAVKSPHVVQIFDYGITASGVPYIVMEQLEGIDLGRFLHNRGRIAIEEVAIIVTHVARALQKAHDRAIVHRDVKPENVFLCDIGTSELFAKLLDFGIAKDTGSELSRLTATGMVIGTPVYMCPEQLLTGRAPGHHADLWGLAAVAYEATTGRRPFAGETVAELAIQHARAQRPRASAFVPDLPPAIDRFFEKAFAVELADRFSSAREMATALLVATGVRLSDPPPASHLGFSAFAARTHDPLAPTKNERALPRAPRRPPLVSRAYLVVAVLFAMVVLGAFLILRT